jgi:S1-C subfamily serine protease
MIHCSKLYELTKRFKLKHIDSAFGSIFSVLVLLGVVWLLASAFSGLPSQTINRQVSGSRIVQELNQLLPPAPAVLTQLSRYLNQDIFPRVFTGPEPQPIAPVDPPDSEHIRQALQAAGESVVRIENVGCGGFITGSGFVVGDGLIMTNAHVIAGIIEPTLVDANGRHRATPILFDQEQDIAVLRTDGDLAGDPLEILPDTFRRGDTGVTLGYPGGGRLEAQPTAVLRQIRAVGHNIYGTGFAARQVYQLQTDITEGNSGGPVVTSQGHVMGVIFARSESSSNVGYALTGSSVIPLLETARNATGSVSTGRCIR